MTRNKNSDSEIILAKVEERLESYMKYTTNDFNKLQETNKNIEETINNINTILTKGDGKISAVKGMIVDHLDCHEKNDLKILQHIKISLGFMSILIAIITVVINILM